MPNITVGFLGMDSPHLYPYVWIMLLPGGQDARTGWSSTMAIELNQNRTKMVLFFTLYFIL